MFNLYIKTVNEYSKIGMYLKQEKNKNSKKKIKLKQNKNKIKPTAQGEKRLTGFLDKFRK